MEIKLSSFFQKPWNLDSRSSLRVQVKEDDRGEVLFLEGEVDESADLSFFSALSSGVKRFNVKGIKHFNSCGVREWIIALRSCPSSIEVFFEECSVEFMEQVNMFNNFLGNGLVHSCYLTYVAPSSGKSIDMLCDLENYESDKGLELPEVVDPETGEELELLHDPDLLFSFLD